MANIQLAANLRYLRDLYDQSQDDAGEIFGISRQAVSNYENLTRMPDLDMLVRIARYYHLTLDQLILHNLANPDSTSSEVTPHNLAIEDATENSIYLTGDEVDFIMSLRSLSNDNRMIIKGFLNSNK